MNLRRSNGKTDEELAAKSADELPRSLGQELVAYAVSRDGLAAVAEIEATRNAIDETISTLHGRLNPQVLKGQALASFSEMKTMVKAELKEQLANAKEFANGELQSLKADALAQLAKTSEDLKNELLTEVRQVKAAVRRATLGRLEAAADDARARWIETGKLIAAHPIRSGVIGSVIASALALGLLLMRRARRKALPAPRIAALAIATKPKRERARQRPRQARLLPST